MEDGEGGVVVWLFVILVRIMLCLKNFKKNLIQWVKVAIEIELAYAINVKQIVQFHNLTFSANNKVGG